MLGIGGALQNQFQHRPPADRHMENVKKINGGGFSSRAKAYQIDGDASENRKRKKEGQESEKEVNKKTKKRKIEVEKTNDGKNLGQIIIESKEKMQGPEKQNGVTFLFLGSSGCGKSTVIIDVFIGQIFGKEATKSRGDKEYLIQIFTLSAKSDAFKRCSKDVLIDDKGLDEDNINFCYHMNENYDKRYNFFIMLDDVLSLRYKDLLQRMFLTMRNTNISSLISIQYAKLVPISIRTSVYFILFFMFNNDEAIEHVVKGWLSAYIEGSSIKEKIRNYRLWTMGNDGHNMFLLDNLNHKCYSVDSTDMKYICYELSPITFEKEKSKENSLYFAFMYTSSLFPYMVNDRFNVNFVGVTLILPE